MPSSWLWFLLSYYVLFSSRSIDIITTIWNSNQHRDYCHVTGAVHGFVVSPLPSSSFTTLRHQHGIPTPECRTSGGGSFVSSDRAARRRPRSSTFSIAANRRDNGRGDFDVVPPTGGRAASTAATRMTDDDEKRRICNHRDDDEDETFSSTKVPLDDALDYLASAIERRLCQCKRSNTTIIAKVGVGLPPCVHDSVNVHDNTNNYDDDDDDGYATIAKGRFIDLTTTIEGEQVLENLFIGDINPTYDKATNKDHHHHHVLGIVQLAITTLQSLLIYGMQIGVKGSDEAQLRTVRHLFRVEDDNINNNVSNNNNNTTTTSLSSSSSLLSSSSSSFWSDSWDEESIRKLKYQRNVTLAKLLLGKLKRKRTSQGAYNLLLELRVWQKHEDIALLRSGFPIQLTTMEKRIVNNMLMEVEQQQHVITTHDVDDMLGIRQDLRHLKVYTIDGESTNDIDDGISVEILKNNDNYPATADPRYRYWIHIADVDRWSPRGSDILKIAERRGTSLYLPSSVLYMFPEYISSDIMSLASNVDKFALSLGVELHPNGTIDTTSIIVTPSLIHVNYRLTYDEVNDMLDEGVGYTEEWEIGTLLSVARVRRAYRISRGSTEGMVPFPIPKSIVTATKKKENDDDDDDDYDISLTIETTHNSGVNTTTLSMGGGSTLTDDVHYDPYCSPISSSQLIVTEMMILAGEAIGKWQKLQPMKANVTVLDDGRHLLPSVLELPFRCQSAPEYKSREHETRQMNFLLQMNKRYPHAWYARRFFPKVIVSDQPGIHYGLGLDCYVQWTSPIRRITDLQVHSSIKRYLRRQRVNELLSAGRSIPVELTNVDLGYDVAKQEEIDVIDYTSGLGMLFAAKPVQYSSSNYWLFEYIRRRVDTANDEVMFECIILGCINKERDQYAIYVYELGLEHRYLSETGKLDEGRRLWLKVASVNPRMELLTFSLSSRSGGIHAQQFVAAPAA